VLKDGSNKLINGKVGKHEKACVNLFTAYKSTGWMAHPNTEIPHHPQPCHHDFVRNWIGFDGVGMGSESGSKHNAGFGEI